MPKRLARNPSIASLIAAARNSMNAKYMRPVAIDQTTTGTSRMRANVMRFGMLKLAAPARAPRPSSRSRPAQLLLRLSISAIEPLHTFRFQRRHRAMGQKRLTYAQAGVDIDAGNRMVELIKPLVKATARAGTNAEIGGFGGLFDLKRANFHDPVLVAATDGVGTKLKIAIQTGTHDTIGIDLVAMSVNDLVVQGAEPLFFLDYFACR